jgi:hypothetical protein
MSYELGDPDDRCCDEQREADIWNEAEEQCERYGVPFDPVLEGLVEDAEDSTRPARTPEEDAEWEADKRAEYEADRCCGHHWGNR